jgi:hypothetical protein|tara:strand:- start:1642 stop:1974 length:333 start_codon:yes stop_codon:yes gene_type:complete
MAIMDAGLFFILLGVAFVSLLVSFKMGSAFKLLGGVLFFVLGLVMMADYDVAYAQNTVLGNGTLAETKTTYIIGDGNDTDDNSNWLGWVFIAIGLFMSLIFFMEMFGNIL